MPLSTSGKNASLDALAALIDFVSLHNAIPNDSGSGEIAGGAPAYSREAIAWAAASGGSVSKDATDPVFDVPGGGTEVKFVGYWSLATGGTFYGFGPINGGSIRGVGSALASSDTITSRGHGLVNGDRVIVFPSGDAAIPAGLSSATEYYVVGASTDTFQLSLTLAGAAVNITSDGEFGFQKFIPEVYNSQGTFTLDDADLDFNG
jgi:hypothetical protein